MHNFNFTNDEKIVLNQLFTGELKSDFNKERCLDDIEFVLSTHQDESIVELYKELREKIKSISVENYELLKQEIPFKLEVDELDVLQE